MDDNTNNPVVQNTANQPIQEAATPPMQSVPAAQPSVGNTAPAEGAKLTLNDLYGPSRPGELQQAAQPPIPPQPPAPEQPAMPAQLPVLERPVVPEPQPPLPPVPEEPVRRMPDQPSVPQENQPLPQAVVTMPQEKPAESEKSPYGGGGFRLPSILRFVVGGLILLFIAAIVWGISSFFFSGSKGGSSNGKVELVYWGLWEDQNVMQPVLDEFHQQHPNVTITYVRQDPKDYTKRLLTRMQDGSGPDIFRIHNSWVYPLQSVLLPLPTSVN